MLPDRRTCRRMLSASGNPENDIKNMGGNLDLVAIISQLKNERDRINQAIAALDGASSDSKGDARKVAPRRRGGMSAEGRRRISEMMKKRWSERRKKARLKG
jgi:hypothetical protein